MIRPAGRCAQLALWGWLSLGLASGGECAETLKLEVSEHAGIRRFGYPIAVRLPDSISADEGHFRLRDGDKPVPAQFRREKTANGAGAWWLDFNLSMLPGEVRTFALEHGADVAATAEPPGLKLEETPDGFIVRNGTNLAWTLGRDWRGLVRAVEANGLRHLRHEGVRLGIADANGASDEANAKDVDVRVLRSGPLAVAVRYEFAPQDGPLAGLKSVVDLTFPVSKSWVEVDWRIDDPRKAARLVRATIVQNLTAPTGENPTLVDFGASSLVYMSLAPRMMGRLHAGSVLPPASIAPRPSWQVLRGMPDRLEPFVSGSANADSRNAEGWAHVMDRERCLALAIDEFGSGQADSIEITAAGAVTIEREFPADSAAGVNVKHCRFWLHFVPFPPQIGAVTSPQSMLSPLSARVSEP